MAQRSDALTIRFGGFALDGKRGTLTRDGSVVPLRPKSFDLLAYLAQHAGRVVSKSELMNAIWRDAVVTDDSLTQCVKDIRRALGDSGRAAIRTVSRRGYLFDDACIDRPTPEPTVAVLPFEDLCADPAQAAFIDGIAEEITNGLACFRTITVLARSSAFAFRPDVRPDIRAVASRLGADYLVEGSVRRRAGMLEVSVRLLRGDRGVQCWSECFEALECDVFEMQATISRQIINRLVTRLDDAGLQRALRKPTDSLESHEAFLRGLALLRGYAAGTNEAACAMFERALQLDPCHGLAYSYLALARLALHGYAFAPPQVLSDAAALSEKGVTLAPEEARCHRILGYARLCRREHEPAEYEFNRALELNPFDADTVAQMGYLLALRGRPCEALEWMDQARRLNPIHPDWYHYDRAIALYALRDYDGAARELERVPRLGPWGTVRLAACRAQLGDLRDAGRLIDQALAENPGFSPLQYARKGIAFEHAQDLEHVIVGLESAIAASKSETCKSRIG
jgi:DNA-binding winged helix-turn-helix (wHTH) protein/tetratricopeptide (TPR) repeat protein